MAWAKIGDTKVWMESPGFGLNWSAKYHGETFKATSKVLLEQKLKQAHRKNPHGFKPRRTETQTWLDGLFGPGLSGRGG